MPVKELFNVVGSTSASSWRSAKLKRSYAVQLENEFSSRVEPAEYLHVSPDGSFRFCSADPLNSIHDEHVMTEDEAAFIRSLPLRAFPPRRQ